VLKAPKALAAGDATIELDFSYAGGGLGKGADLVLKVNGQKVGEGKMKATVFARFGADTFGVGEDSGQPVTPDYEPPFKFTGTIDQVVIELGPANLSPGNVETVRKAEHRAFQMTE
jgi:arylsulfatase